MFLLLDELKHKLKLTELFLCVVMEVPIEGKSLFRRDHSSAVTLLIIKSGRSVISDTVEDVYLGQHLAISSLACVLHILHVFQQRRRALIYQKRRFIHLKCLKVVFGVHAIGIIVFSLNLTHLLLHQRPIQLQFALNCRKIGGDNDCLIKNCQSSAYKGIRKSFDKLCCHVIFIPQGDSLFYEEGDAAYELFERHDKQFVLTEQKNDIFVGQ